jgi:hypothetical protein
MYCADAAANHISIFLITNQLIDKAPASVSSLFKLDVPNNEITTIRRRSPHELIHSYSETQLTKALLKSNHKSTGKQSSEATSNRANAWQPTASRAMHIQSIPMCTNTSIS